MSREKADDIITDLIRELQTVHSKYLANKIAHEFYARVVARTIDRENERRKPPYAV